jgi:hypothetical protein
VKRLLGENKDEIPSAGAAFRDYGFGGLGL